MVMLLAMSACAVDLKNEYDPHMQICFQPVMHIASKAEADEEYPTKQPFVVSAWTLDREDSWDTEATNAEVYLAEVTALFDEADGWKTPDGTLWPSRQKSLTVMAYAPTEAFDGCSVTDGVTCTYDMLHTQEDLLYTHPQTDLDKVECNGVITLPFDHALAQVNFEVKNRVRQDEEIIIKSIQIDGIMHQGHFKSLPEPTWVTEGEKVPLLFFEGEQATHNEPMAIGRTWYIIPQLLSTYVTVEYEYRTAADTGLSMALKTCELETNIKPGREYTYTLSVGIDDVKFLVEIIEDRFKK